MENPTHVLERPDAIVDQLSTDCWFGVLGKLNGPPDLVPTSGDEDVGVLIQVTSQHKFHREVPVAQFSCRAPAKDLHMG